MQPGIGWSLAQGVAYVGLTGFTNPLGGRFSGPKSTIKLLGRYHEPSIEYLAIIVEKAKWKPLKLLPTPENIVHLKQYNFPGVMSEVTFTLKRLKK